MTDLALPRVPTFGVSRRMLVTSVAYVGVAMIGWSILAAGSGGDAHAYWSASQVAPYGSVVDERDAYVYSPAFLQAFAPLQLLPWEAFRFVWLVAGLGALVWMTGPVVAVLLLLPGMYSPVWTDLYFGNIYVFMAAALALGLRYPAAWAFLALTKVTPGIAIVWFALRREWRQFGIASAAMIGIALISFLVAPHLWFEWIDTLAASNDTTVLSGVPSLGIRLVVAAALLALGAWRGWVYMLPIVVLLAQPVLWYSAFTLLVVWFAQLRSYRHLKVDRVVARRDGLGVEPTIGQP